MASAVEPHRTPVAPRPGRSQPPGTPCFQVERAITWLGAGDVTREANPLPGQRRQLVGQVEPPLDEHAGVRRTSPKPSAVRGQHPLCRATAGERGRRPDARWSSGSTRRLRRRRRGTSQLASRAWRRRGFGPARLRRTRPDSSTLSSCSGARTSASEAASDHGDRETAQASVSRPGSHQCSGRAAATDRQASRGPGVRGEHESSLGERRAGSAYGTPTSRSLVHLHFGRTGRRVDHHQDVEPRRVGEDTQVASSAVHEDRAERRVWRAGSERRSRPSRW